eukprot:GCRY01005074.1.p1 GENE.GCRY01005074.1~~GCRY01005074.1.p1  ORF type:complete len:679 (+),score=107.74 GCRY01005074.1:230-2266(+)
MNFSLLLTNAPFTLLFVIGLFVFGIFLIVRKHTLGYNIHNEGNRLILPGESTKPQIRLLCYNIFIRPPFIKNNEDDYKSERLNQFLQRIDEFDVICLQEMFSAFSWRKANFIAQAQAVGFKYYISNPSGLLSDGGLLILSRYPIVDFSWLSFSASASADSIAQKGALHAKILVGNSFVHVFNTHLQSDYIGGNLNKTRLARASQIKELRHFVLCSIALEWKAALSQKDPKFPLVLLTGDFNINGRCERGNGVYSFPQEFTKTANTQHPRTHPVQHPSPSLSLYSTTSTTSSNSATPAPTLSAPIPPTHSATPPFLESPTASTSSLVSDSSSNPDAEGEKSPSNSDFCGFEEFGNNVEQSYEYCMLVNELAGEEMSVYDSALMHWGYHPVTYADGAPIPSSIPADLPVFHPMEVALTNHDDLCTRQCLDYIFFLFPSSKFISPSCDIPLPPMDLSSLSQPQSLSVLSSHLQPHTNTGAISSPSSVFSLPSIPLLEVSTLYLKQLFSIGLETFANAREVGGSFFPAMEGVVGSQSLMSFDNHHPSSPSTQELRCAFSRKYTSASSSSLLSERSVPSSRPPSAVRPLHLFSSSLTKLRRFFALTLPASLHRWYRAFAAHMPSSPPHSSPHTTVTSRHKKHDDHGAALLDSLTGPSLYSQLSDHYGLVLTLNASLHLSTPCV